MSKQELRSDILGALNEHFSRPQAGDSVSAHVVADDIMDIVWPMIGTHAIYDSKKHTPVRKYRINAGMTQEEVAIAVGVSRVAVTNWERRGGRGCPSFASYRKLAKLFNTTIDSLDPEQKESANE